MNPGTWQLVDPDCTRLHLLTPTAHTCEAVSSAIYQKNGSWRNVALCQLLDGLHILYQYIEHNLNSSDRISGDCVRRHAGGIKLPSSCGTKSPSYNSQAFTRSLFPLGRSLPFNRLSHLFAPFARFRQVVLRSSGLWLIWS
jgi:hypothetical protein